MKAFSLSRTLDLCVSDQDEAQGELLTLILKDECEYMLATFDYMLQYKLLAELQSTALDIASERGLRFTYSPTLQVVN